MMPAELRNLILRFNQIGAALPDEDTVRTGGSRCNSECEAPRRRNEQGHG
jgi:hypothetical protein